MMNHLLVVLQSHSQTNALKPKETHFRYVDAPKIEVSLRCILSLVHSLNYARIRNKNLEIELAILDDHSSQDFLSALNPVLDLACFPVKLIHLDTYGIMPSIASCYDYAKEHARDYVYFVQDDFLHHEHAIHLMLKNYDKFFQFLGNDLCLTGWHDTRFLLPDTINNYDCKVVPGIEGFWRTLAGAPFTMLTSAKLFMNNFDLFEQFGKEDYNDEDCENKTINWLFANRNYSAFCPITSLVLQIQWDVHKDPYVPWAEWWEKYDLKKFFGTDYYLPTDLFYMNKNQ